MAAMQIALAGLKESFDIKLEAVFEEYQKE